MCIRLNCIEESPKVAESDMTTYKILEVLKDMKTGGKSYYSPISINRQQYNIGELYTEPLGKTEYVQHIYYPPTKTTHKCIAETTTGLYSYRDLKTAVEFMRVLENGIMALSMAPKYKIFQCSIPKGSKYYAPSTGNEIVSDHLEIVSQVSLN